ncbi:MAG: PilZ domain-containing protein [Bdellovibrionota bacterium]
MSSEKPKKIVDSQNAAYLLANLNNRTVHLIHKTKNFDELIPLEIITVAKSRVLAKTKSLLHTKNGSFQFEFQGEIYLFDTTMEQTDESISLDLPFDIYQLQRREDFRLPIPDNGPVKILVKGANGSTQVYSASDICSGGAKIICPDSTKLILGETYQTELQIENEDPIPVQSRVQHLKDITYGKNKIEAGLHFVNMSEKEQNSVYRMVILLYRRLYLRGLKDPL